MKNKKSAVTIGTFDGVHKGHKLLIRKTLETAKKNNLKSIIVTLEKPVRCVSGLLSPFGEKMDLMKKTGIDEIIVVPLLSEILSMSPDEFYEKILINDLQACHIICGSDFAFGKNRKGNTRWLTRKTKRSNVTVDIVKPLKISGHTVSSSLIRSLLHKNDIKNANKYLGREYSFSGIPFKEKGIGSKIGFPTVNLMAEKDKILPKGVFVSIISRGKKTYPSVTNIGYRPTLNRGEAVVPETHILGFKGDWGKKVTEVVLLKKIRNEKKFKDIEELKKSISKDIKKAKEFFNLP